MRHHELTWTHVCVGKKLLLIDLRKISNATPYIDQSLVTSIIASLCSEIINYEQENRASAANGIISVDLLNKIRVSHTKTFNLLPNPA